MSVTPQPVVIQVVGSHAPIGYDGYHSLAAKSLGICQVILGALAIIFNAASIGLKLETAYSGYAFGSGIFWIIAGSFGIGSAFRKSTCTIVTTLVLSVLSAAGLLSYVTYASYQLVEATEIEDGSNGIPDGCGCFNESRENGTMVEVCVHCVTETEAMRHGAIAVSSMMLLVGLAELVVAIAASVVCCRAVCCCSERHSNGSQDTSGCHVTVNTQSGPQTVSLPPGYQCVTPAYDSTEKKQMQHGVSPPPPYSTGTVY